MPLGSPFPGPWTNERAPWLVEPMNAFSRPGVDYVVGLMASQLGKTEAQFNVLGWMWDTRPQPAIYLCPTEKLARTLARDRLPQMIQTVPVLRDAVDKRTKPFSLERWINGVRFGMAWSGSATEVASHPCAIVHVDERSRMEDIPGEGDPVRLAGARTKMYPGSKVGIWSSPTSEASCPTYRWWLAGTKHRWSWECPGCGWWFAPELQYARYPEGASFEEIKVASWIECPRCEHKIRDSDRGNLGQAYVPHVLHDDQLEARPGLETCNPIASYWVTGFASPITGIGEIMYQYAVASRAGDPGETRAVVNTYAGELWSEPGEKLAADVVKARQRDAIIDDVQLVTMGVDVQQNCLYWGVRGWAPNVTSQLLAHGVVHGPTEYDDVWIALQRIAADTYCGRSIDRVLVDSGYNTAQVYEVCRRNGWSPSKGMARQDKPYRDTLVDESASGRALKRLRLWIYCADTWKTWLYARMQWPEDTPGAWYVPAGIDDQYCAQVTNERVVWRHRKRVWETTKDRQNHFLDVEVLCAVGAHICNVRSLRATPQKPKDAPKRPPPPPRNTSFQRQAL